MSACCRWRVQINEDWHLTHERVRAMPEHRRRTMLQNLRALVIAFDSIPGDERDRLTTAEEIIRNRAWLIKIAQQLVLVDGVADGGKKMEKARQARLARERAQREAEVKVALDAAAEQRRAEEAAFDASADDAVSALLHQQRLQGSSTPRHARARSHNKGSTMSRPPARGWS